MNLKQICLLAGLLIAGPTPTLAQDYDLVVSNGRVMDPETGYNQVANVGIRNSKIAVITEDNLSGVKTIDASGHVVAPGFIDMHNHVGGLPLSAAF